MPANVVMLSPRGLAFGEPDDGLQRGIQDAATDVIFADVTDYRIIRFREWSHPSELDIAEFAEQGSDRSNCINRVTQALIMPFKSKGTHCRLPLAVGRAGSSMRD